MAGTPTEVPVPKMTNWPRMSIVLSDLGNGNLHFPVGVGAMALFIILSNVWLDKNAEKRHKMLIG